MIIHNVEQNTEEWDKLRLGKFTASVADKLLTDRGNKGYIDLIKKIFEEQYTGEPCESKAWQGNKYTDRGHELESFALEAYERENFCDVESVGFIELNKYVGCSPDSFVGEDALVQAKCPIFDTQMGYLEIMEMDIDDIAKMRKISSGYYKQMQFELYVTDRKWNDFYSWHPKLDSVQIRVDRDYIMIKQIETRLAESIELVNKRVKELR